VFLLTRKRLAWLATCAMFVACASAPETRPTKKKKKKRSKDSIALKKKKQAEDDEDTKPRKNKDSEDEEKKKSAEEDKPKAEDEEVMISDDSEEESSKSNKKKNEQEVAAKAKKKKEDKKKEEKAEQEAAKKKKKEEEAAEEDGEVAAKSKKKKKEEPVEEDGGEVAAKSKKKKKEEPEEDGGEVAAKSKKKKKEEPVEEDGGEVAATSKKKKEEPVEDDGGEVAAKSKKKKKEEPTKVAAKSKKKVEEEPETVAEEPEEPEPTKVAAKSKKKDTKKKTAAIDMSNEEGPVIDMEDEVGKEPERVEDQPPDRRGVAIPVPGVDSGEEAPEEATPIGANPLAINERPLVLAKSKLAVHGGLQVKVLTLTPAGGMPTSTTTESLALGVNYGVGDSSEIGFDYAAGLNPGTAKGPITLHGAYKVSASAKLDVAIAAALAVDFSGFTDPVTMQTTSSTNLSLQIGAWARYRVGRKASIFTGVPATPDSTVILSKLAFALPPIPYQLAIGFNNAGTIALDLPVGVGYQATPKIYVLGVLDLAHIRVANTANAFLFKDFIPLTLGGFYALDKLDIGVQFSDDLKQGADYLRFETLVRYSIK